MCLNCSSSNYASRYVGLLAEKAKLIALRQGFSNVKFIQIGAFAVLESRKDRINFWIINGKVAKAAVG